jgi:four helix bundle protein
MVHSYRELDAWRLSVELKDKILPLLKSGEVVRDFDFCKQLRDSARSVPRNIAEGFGRFNPGEFVYFLGVARGSLDESENSLRDGVASSYFPAETIGPLIRLLARCRICVNRLQAYERKAQLDPRFNPKTAKKRRGTPVRTPRVSSLSGRELRS